MKTIEWLTKRKKRVAEAIFGTQRVPAVFELESIALSRLSLTSMLLTSYSLMLRAFSMLLKEPANFDALQMYY